MMVQPNKNVDICALPTLWQQLGEEAHVKVMVRHPHGLALWHHLETRSSDFSGSHYEASCQMAKS